MTFLDIEHRDAFSREKKKKLSMTGIRNLIISTETINKPAVAHMIMVHIIKTVNIVRNANQLYEPIQSDVVIVLQRSDELKNIYAFAVAFRTGDWQLNNSM